MKIQSSLVLCALFVCAAMAYPDVTDVTFSPNWVHIRGGDVINVCGCGFSKYDNVICLWNNRWASSYSAILDDGNILCESPPFDAEEMTRNGGAPQNMRLDIVFGGDYNDRLFLGWVRVGPEIDPYNPIEPSASYVSGGVPMSVYGQGFDDIWGSDVAIYFDDVPCASASVVSDTELRCASVPRGALSQDAVVTVEFFASHNNSAYFYLHSLETWAYGPRFTKIEPSCASPFGGTPLAIKGTFLNDPAAITGVNNVDRPMIVLFVQDDVIQVFGQFQGAETIQFTSPDIPLITDNKYDADDLWNTAVGVEVYSQQVMSINQRDYASPLGYTLGAYLYSNRLPLVNGNSFATAANSWPHFGGQDQICLLGCGWEQFSGLENRLEMRTSTTSTGAGFQEICNGAGSTISVSGSGDESRVCCNSVVEHDSCTESTSRYWSVTQDVPEGVTSADFFDGATLTAPTTIGPVFDNDMIGHITTLNGGSRAYTGKAFKYSNNAVSTDAAGWSAGELCYEFSQYDPIDTTLPFAGQRCNSATSNRIVINSDTSLSIDYPGNDFDTTAYVTIDFKTTDCVNYEHGANHWGPFCGEVDYFLDDEYEILDDTWGLSVVNGPVSGGNQITITGTGLNQYGATGDVKVLFCQRYDGGVGSSCGGPLSAGCTQSRFVDNTAQVDSCKVYNIGGVSNINNNSVTITTPRYSEEGILWGDYYDVYLYWGLDANSYSNNYISGKSSVIDLEFNVDTDQVTRKLCGRYRYGPTVEDTGCLVGPEGPAATRIPLNQWDGDALDVVPANDNGVLTPFTIPGTNMADNWSGLDRTKNPHKVFVGETLGADVTNPSANSLSTATLWDGHVEDDVVNVGVIFDTCNTSFSGEYIQYGPVITQITCEGIPGNPANPPSELHVDLWGFKPFTRRGLYGPQLGEYDDENGYDIIRIRGQGFEEFCSDVYDNDFGSCHGNHISYARAIIDSEYSPWTIIRQCDDGSTDGVETDDGCYEILAAVPPRPFGTVAQVAVEFGDTDCPNQNPSTEAPVSGWLDGLYPAREIDWTRVLIADQKLHFEPKITSVTPDVVKASLRDVDDFTVTGYGFLRWDTSNADVSVVPRCLLNHTPLAVGSIIDDETITCARPADLRGEFNTDVPFHVYFDNDDGEVVDPNFRQVPINFKGDSSRYFESAYDWKIAAPELIHEGPVCSISPGLSYDFSEEFLLDVAVTGFRDCEEFDDDDEDRPDTAGTFDGRLYCMQRDFAVELVVESQNDRTSVILNIDSWNASYSDSGFAVDVRGLNFNEIDCDYTAHIQLRSLDAIVHADPANQRVVVCGNSFQRGPRISGVESDWFRNDVHYGWVDDLITVYGSHFLDSEDRLASPQCSFGGQLTAPESFTDTEIVCRAPQLNALSVENHWDHQVPVSIVWVGSGSTEVACEKDAFTWHYGPGLIYQPYCNDPYHIDNTNQDVDVEIIAGSCCGLDVSETRCIFPGTYDVEQINYNTQSTPTTAGDVLTCRIPQQSTPFRGIGGFGVSFFFNSETPEFFHSIGECSKSSGDKCLVETIDERFNSICYGFDTSSISPDHVRTSYIAENDDITAPHEDHAEDIDVIYSGVNSDFTDDLVEEIRCNLHVEGGSTITDLGLADVSSTVATCSLLNAVFTKHCRDTPDSISLTYVLTNNGGNVQERTTWDTPTSFSNNMPITFGQSGEIVKYPITHGPLVTSVVPHGWDENNAARGNRYGALRSFTSGGLELEITLSHYKDFVGEGTSGAGTSEFDFGWENSIVSFGNLGYDFTPFGESISTGSITAHTSNGLFRSYGEVRVHLDPHTDALTDFGENENDYLFRPYITGMSRVYGNQAGRESIAFYGHGFCKDNYNQVYSQFGAPSPLGGYGACDITNDHVVVCQTPYSGDGARVASPSLYFNQDCDANCGDAVEVPSDIPYTYYGYIAVTTPFEAPVYGYTDVTFTVLGLNYFDDVECWFDGSNDVQYQGEVIDRTDSTITCRTPNMEGVRSTNPYLRVFHNPDYFKDCDGNVIYDSDSTDFSPISYLRPRDIIYSPNPITFDDPCPLDVYSENTGFGNVTEGAVESGINVFVEGRFFNGGRNIEDGGEYICQFRSYGSRDRFIDNPRYLEETTAISREVIPEPNQNFDWSTYRLLCPVPRDLVGGLWGVKVRWDGADSVSQCTAAFLVDAGVLLSVSPILMVMVCIYQLFF